MKDLGGLSSPEWRARLELLGEALEETGAKATLVLLGSVPNILRGQESRSTIDLDVWNPKSEFDGNKIRRAAEKAGLLYNPRGVEEPTTPYIQIVDPGIVQLGEFIPIKVEKFGGLTVLQAPGENLVASKLCRSEPQDLQDIAWMVASYGISVSAVKKVIAQFPKEQREIAQENLVYLDVMVTSTELPEIPRMPKLPGDEGYGGSGETPTL